MRPELFMLGTTGALVAAYSYRTRSHGRAQFARLERESGSALLSQWMMEAVYWALQPVARALIAIGITPNQITWTSLVLGAGAGVAFALGDFGIGAVVAAVSAVLDSLDGMIARLTGTSSNAGEILDASVDRYSEFFFLAGIAIYYRWSLPILVVALFALAGSYMVSYSSAKAEILGVTPPRGSMRRPERAAYLTLGAALTPLSIRHFEILQPHPLGYPMLAMLVLVCVVANISAILRLTAIARLSRQMTESR